MYRKMKFEDVDHDAWLIRQAEENCIDKAEDEEFDEEYDAMCRAEAKAEAMERREWW